VAEITLEGVTKTFARSVTAVDDVSMNFADGEFVALVGPSGCGKSTLLRMVAGLEEVTSGRILICGRDVTYASARERDVAMVFQNYALYPHMNVRKNLAYGLRTRKMARKEIDRRVNDVARMLGLDDLLDRRPSALSGGQRQRVAMGRAIVREPQAFLMDEPLSNLDAKLRVSMRAQLAALHSRLQTTTIFVTHDQVEAMTLGHRVAVLRDGRVQQFDAPQTLYRNPVNLFVATFIGSPAMNVVGAHLEQDSLRFGKHRLPLESGAVRVKQGPVVMGIRPEHLEDARFADNRLPSIQVTVAVVEDLGADLQVIFTLDAPAVDHAQVRESREDEEGLLPEDRAIFTARLDARTHVRPGETLQLSVNPQALYFFDPASGVNLAKPAQRDDEIHERDQGPTDLLLTS
jgi:multiple sugar transport system ATP-binding protein